MNHFAIPVYRALILLNLAFDTMRMCGMPDQVCMLPAMETIPETFSCHALISMDVLSCVTGHILKCITVRHRPGMKPFPQCLKATSRRNPKKSNVFICRALSYRLLIIPTNPIVIQSRSMLPLVVSAVLICLTSQAKYNVPSQSESPLSGMCERWHALSCCKLTTTRYVGC